MSNFAPNQFNSVPGAPPANPLTGQQYVNHGQAPLQGNITQKQDPNLNNPMFARTSTPQNYSTPGPNINHYSNSTPTSQVGIMPSSNQMGMAPPNNQMGMVPPTNQIGMVPLNNQIGMMPPTNQKGMIPPISQMGMVPPTSQMGMVPPTSQMGIIPPSSQMGIIPPSSQMGMMHQPTTGHPTPPLAQQIPNSTANLFPRHLPASQIPPVSNMPISSQPQSYSAPKQINLNAPPLVPTTGQYYTQPVVNGPPGPPSLPASQPTQYPPTSRTFSPQMNMNQPSATMGQMPPMQPTGPPAMPKPPVPIQNPSGPYGPGGPLRNPPMTGPTASAPNIGVNGAPSSYGMPNASTMGPPQGLPSGPASVGPPNIGPPLNNGPKPPPPLNYPGQPPRPQMGYPPGPPMAGPSMQPCMPGVQAMPGPQSLPPMSQPNFQPPPSLPPTSGYPTPSNMQSRYPPAQASQGQPQANVQQYGTQGVTQGMGQLSVTKQGFDQLWGHQSVDLLQCRHVLPEHPVEPPEIKLHQQFAEASNCSPEIFRCTINRIPETNSLLQKSRLPLGILIHPFKDLNHLPVIQCATIVRCRACRTYINPFVYFVDNKRWKCNLCYRVNDLPEEFQYDPVSKSYGDPSRRPEVRAATIEFIAPAEYMLRPPQPAVYLFLLDVSQMARDSGYLEVFCSTLSSKLSELPGDARTQLGLLCYGGALHYYSVRDGLGRPKELVVTELDEAFLPSPADLLINLAEHRDMITELLAQLPRRYAAPAPPACALGAALQAALRLMAPTGGRITVFQTCLPNLGPGALQSREDPNARSAKDVAHLNPASDFYKRLALDCSGAQVAVDLFLLNSHYADLATLSGMSKFSGGSVYHIPLFSAARGWQAALLQRQLTRYLTRKIGFEAVMRVRATRGISIHTFHGNFFVRSTDLLSLPNVSPDAGFGMQLTIDESLSDLQQVCFQAALLYTSSKGERRIRVHTLALPVTSTLPDVLHAADQQCIVGLLAKMAVDRCAAASLPEAREALTTVAVDALSAYRLAQNMPAGAGGLPAPVSLSLLPLYLLALLKRKAFRVGTSTRLDDRVADMCALKTRPLEQLVRGVYPDLYPVHLLVDCEVDERELPRLQLSAEKVNSTGAYLLDDGDTMLLYVGHAVSQEFIRDVFDVHSFHQVEDEARSLPRLETDGSQLLHLLIERLNDERPYPSDILVLKDNSASRTLFTERLVDDRVENSFSYYEFLQHVKTQVK